MKAHFSLFPFILNVHHNQLDTLTFSIKTGVWKPVWHCIALNPVYCEDFSLLLRDSFTQGIHWKSPWSTQLHGNSGWKLMKESKLLTVSYKACCLRTKTKKTYQLRIHSEQIIKNLNNDKNWKTETKISVCMFEKWMKGKNICVCVFVCACKRVCVYMFICTCVETKDWFRVSSSLFTILFFETVSLSLSETGTCRFGWMANKTQGCLHLSMFFKAEVTGVHLHSQLFVKILKLQTHVFMLLQQGFLSTSFNTSC